MNKTELFDWLEKLSRMERKACGETKVLFRSHNKMIELAQERATDEELSTLTVGLFSAWCRGEGVDFGLEPYIGECAYRLSHEGKLLRIHYDKKGEGAVVASIQAEPKDVAHYLSVLRRIKEGELFCSEE